MLSNEWKHLKSGTDIRGVAIPDVDGPVDLTDDVVERIAAGFLRWLCTKNQKQPEQQTISVGRDSRLSGPRMRDAVVKALVAGGATVLDCGLASTPAMFMTTVDLGCDGAVQLTASHHPYHRNGLKFFLPSGGLEGSDIEAVLQNAQDGIAPPAASGCCRSVEYMTQYAARLRRLICDGVKAADYDHPLAGFHIVVDAGNGAGGFYAGFLEKLGAEVTGGLEPAGTAADGRALTCGRVGKLPNPMTMAEFLPYVAGRLHANGLRYVDGGLPVERIAVCGGFGGNMLELAAAKGCDTFVTADIKYDRFLAAKELGINLIDADHFCTENVAGSVAVI